jgi:hypothetical protein
MQHPIPLGDDWFTWDPETIHCYPCTPHAPQGAPKTPETATTDGPRGCNCVVVGKDSGAR